MIKAVMISIRPKWCDLIASGKKTIEVRKTKPLIDVPFKSYIYCTKSKEALPEAAEMYIHGSGTVIGEFVCDAVIPMSIKYSDPNSRIALREFPYTCLTDKQIIDYLGNGLDGFGWHISDLVIYGEPKNLEDYRIKRPPQSWFYVEEMG